MSIVKFEFEGRTLRTVQHNGETWFVARDVCDILEISNVGDALARLDPEDRGIASIDTPGGNQEVSIVNESGLYDLVLGSRKPEAKPFKRWVTKEVIPSIRKGGGYLTGVSAQDLADPDVQQALNIARMFAEQKAQARALRAQEERLALVEATTHTSSDYITAMGMLRTMGIRDVDRSMAQRVGMRAGALCRAEGREIRKVPDAMFGELNAYPRDIALRAASEVFPSDGAD
jgi:prophage antirepressor-like protein